MGYYRRLSGPVIAGPPGFPCYWTKVAFSDSAKRKKPKTAFALLSEPTTLSTFRWTEKKDPAYFDGVLKAPLLHGLGEPQSHLYLPVVEAARLKEDAHKKLLEKIKGEKWNLGTFVGELPATQKYMKTAVGEIVSAYRKLRKGDMKSLKKLAKRGRAYLKKRGVRKTAFELSGKASGRWMEFRYAISPIVYDLDDMFSALYDSQSRPVISRVAAGSRNRYSDVTTEEYALYKIQRATSGTSQGRAVAYFTVSPTVSSFKRLGLINLGAVLWELTPLSFVADWFLPIGDYIGHLDAMAGVTVLSATYSVKVTGNQALPSVTYAEKRYDMTYYNVTVGGQSNSYESYQRTLLSVGTPSFVFGSSPAGKQLVDAVALARLLLFK